MNTTPAIQGAPSWGGRDMVKAKIEPHDQKTRGKGRNSHMGD